MNLQKNVAEKTLKSASNNKVNAVRIYKDATASDKSQVLKDVAKDAEALIKKNRTVTVIVISD